MIQLCYDAGMSDRLCLITGRQREDHLPCWLETASNQMPAQFVRVQAATSLLWHHDPDSAHDKYC